MACCMPPRRSPCGGRKYKEPDAGHWVTRRYKRSRVVESGYTGTSFAASHVSGVELVDAVWRTREDMKDRTTLVSLPHDVLRQIANHLTLEDWAKAASTCRLLRDLQLAQLDLRCCSIEGLLQVAWVTSWSVMSQPPRLKLDRSLPCSVAMGRAALGQSQLAKSLLRA